MTGPWHRPPDDRRRRRVENLLLGFIAVGVVVFIIWTMGR